MLPRIGADRIRQATVADDRVVSEAYLPGGGMNPPASISKYIDELLDFHRRLDDQAVSLAQRPIARGMHIEQKHDRSRGRNVKNQFVTDSNEHKVLARRSCAGLVKDNLL